MMCMYSRKELNDINDIKLSEIDHRLFLLDDLINTAYINNNSIKMSKQNMNINRNEISAQKSRHFPTVDIVAEYDYMILHKVVHNLAQQQERILQYHLY